MLKILVIDDDKKLCELIGEYLSPMGFEVTAAYSGDEGLSMALQEEFVAIILDVMIPGIDGFEVLRRLRKESDIPVLMFTARGEETDRIVGLEMGADDYLPKTFSSRELLARLRAVIRRSVSKKALSSYNENSDAKDDVLKIKDLVIYRARRSVKVSGQEVELTPVEFDILETLAVSAGRVLSRDFLLDSVSGRDYSVFDRSIDVHISSLRKKIKDDPRLPDYIRTVRGAGYMFIG